MFSRDLFLIKDLMAPAVRFSHISSCWFHSDNLI